MAVRTGKTGSKTSTILFEALEQRQYASASKLIPTTPGFIGPVQPASPTTTTTDSTTSSTTSGGSSNSKQFMLYDSTFADQNGQTVIYPGFQQAYWTGAVGMQNYYDPSEPYASQKQIDVVANLAKNGGSAFWTNYQVQPGALTFLDFESDSNQSVSYYVQRLNWFHQADPTGKVGIWGLTPGLEGLDRDEVLNPNPQEQAQIAAQMKQDAPLVNAMDVLIVSSYMLGPAYVNRDLQFISAEANLYHEYFPGKPVLAWTWGVYHPSWNPVDDILPADVTQEYVQTCMNCCDGMIVWGSHLDNNLLLQTTDELVQPALTDATLPPQLMPNQTGSVAPAAGESNDTINDLFSNQQIDSSVESLVN